MGRQPPIQTVHPAPGVPVPGTAVVPGSGAHAGTPICDCYIRGTVEVQSEARDDRRGDVNVTCTPAISAIWSVSSRG